MRQFSSIFFYTHPPPRARSPFSDRRIRSELEKRFNRFEVSREARAHERRLSGFFMGLVEELLGHLGVAQHVANLFRIVARDGQIQRRQRFRKVFDVDGIEVDLVDLRRGAGDEKTRYEND